VCVSIVHEGLVKRLPSFVFGPYHAVSVAEKPRPSSGPRERVWPTGFVNECVEA
jgi:hypothetical protein